MFCSSCGAQIPDGSTFCPKCGTNLTAGAAPNAGMNRPVPQAQPDQFGGMPMKWHKFLVYFALWASGILNILTGFFTLSGGQYEGDAEKVYYVFRGMKTLDTVYGLVVIVIGVLLLFTAYRLLKLKTGAPKLLLACLAITAVVSIAYSVMATNEIHSVLRNADTSEITASAIGSAIGSAVSFVLHMIYYKKRNHLFVN